MTDSPYNSVESDSIGEHIDQSDMADHEALYSNPEKAAAHLIKKYGAEKAREIMEEEGYGEEFIEEALRRSEDEEESKETFGG